MPPNRRSHWLDDRVFAHATVREMSRSGRSWRHIRFQLEDVDSWRWRPGQQIRLVVSAESLLFSVVRGNINDYLRTYSVFGADETAGTFEIFAFDHADGTTAANWFARLAVGDRVGFRGPEGNLTVQSGAAYHLFVGEETAQAAFAPMLAEVSATAPVHGVIEVADPADELALPRRDELTWLHRGSSSAVESSSLLRAVQGLELPAEPGVAYIAGEARTSAAVRRHLIDARGWRPGRGSILVKPFWAPGKRGLD